jgi:hypothetical protein
MPAPVSGRIDACPYSKLCTPAEAWKSLAGGRSVGGMLTVLSVLWSLLCCRLRSRAVLELEILALRHQLMVFKRQRPSRPRLSTVDRLLWIWLYLLWPRCLGAMVLVKPATVIHWYRSGFRLYWWYPAVPAAPPSTAMCAS